MVTYKISTPNGDHVATVQAQGHRQHIWNEGRLIGVSKAGVKKLALLPSGDHLYSPLGGTWSATLVGWEGKP